MVQFNTDFLGTTVVDKLFSNPMVPWVIADVKRRKKVQKVNLTIEDGEIIGKTDDVVIFRHNTQNLQRFCIEPNNMRTFMYLLRDEFEPVLNVYLFQSTEFEDVVEIFQTLRESVRDSPNMTKSHSSAAALTSLCPGISPTNSQFFEVLYVGKMKVSHRKVPDTFIDDALERIRLFELEKSRKLLEQINDESEKLKALDSKLNSKNCESGKQSESGNSGDSDSGSDHKTLPSEAAPKENSLENSPDKNVSAEGEAKVDPPPEGRNQRSRAGSLGVIETFKKKVDDSNQNRTMLFYVGRSDLRLISPDRKQVLLHKMLKDINCCIQGIENNQHFGIISRETECYVGYVFKCESDSVADHIVSAISQSFQSIKDKKDRPKQPVLSCEHCPMVWFHKLCSEIEGVNEKKTQLTILKRIETLPEHEQSDIHTKFLGAESSDIKEQNEFLMILLRTHCERKQSRHVHDSAETRSEFLNQVLGGNTIFMKAKRSLTSSFDQLLKRKGSQTDIFHSKESASRKSDSVINECGNDEYQRSYLTVGPADGEIMRKEISKHMSNAKNENENLRRKFQNDRSADTAKNSDGKNATFPDIAALTVNNQKIEKALRSSPEKADSPEGEASKTPMINMFLKVGSTSKTPPQDSVMMTQMNQTPSGSWRQAIFNRVVTPGKTDEGDEKQPRKKTKEELRELWKTAINQQILLIRMEKENARLRARQEEATVKRIKLEYDELGSCSKEYMGIWDLISTKDNRISSKCDSQILLQAVRQGVPRARRGEVWHFFAVQYCLKQPPFDSSGFANYDVPYEDLLKQLTSFQHAILIDLGRTFPNHPYYSSPLGPGQLSLFNLLKGYSLLDTQVGYCQGLSFVAGVLLLHMSEDTAFLLLRHLMFRRGLRKQYLPDMAAVQVQLYQLSRLIHDTFPKLYAHFDKNEIAPTLYATSWMLTLFASQFPLGFVTRVFDLLFMEQTLWTEVLFRVIMAILDQHKDALLKQSTFEEIMEYLKNDVPKMDAACVDTIIKKAISLDISKQLHEYEVEYHVLQEEMSTPRPELDQLRKVKAENRKLMEQNLGLTEQLDVVTKNINRLEKLRLNQQGSINKLETKVRSLEIAIATLGEFISEVTEEHKDVFVPGDIRRLIANLEPLKSQKHGKNEFKKSFEKAGFLRKMHSSIDFHEKPHFSELCTPDDLPNGTKHGEETRNEKQDGHKSAFCKGVPLKVIVDDDDNDERKRAHQQSPTLTSKITSGVSSFFNASHNQIIKNQKNKKMQELPASFNNVKTEEIPTDNSKSKHNFSSEIGSLNIKESVIHSQRKETQKNVDLSNSNNCDEVKTGHTTSATPDDSGTHFHPLDTCSDVNITYNGTTKLKTLKSGHKLTKHNTVDLIPVNKDLLHISEENSPSKENAATVAKKSIKATFTSAF